MEVAELLEECVKLGVDGSFLIDNEYTREQVCSISHGIGIGADVRVFSNPKLTSTQMHFLRVWLHHDYDVTGCNDPSLTLDEARTRLEQNSPEAKGHRYTFSQREAFCDKTKTLI
jgi:hypothetical protein